MNVSMSKISLKYRVAELLDERKASENKRTRVVTLVIVGLILISAIQVVLESEPGTEAYARALDVVNVICTVVFTVELALRIWTADCLDEEYVGFWGRLRFLKSPYTVIDIVAILPAAASLVMPGTSWASLKVLRILRLLKLARFLRSFNFIIEATRKKKAELSISMQILLLLTFILSVLLHRVENVAQPDEFASIWHAMLWATSQYIGDFGGYADFRPITAAGKILATCVGVLSIAIFAVPSGIIASGFVEEMEDEKKAKELEGNAGLIVSSFAPKRVARMGLDLPVRKRTLPFLQAKLELTADEIILAIRSSEQLRLKWEKSSPELKVSDLIVVECFEKNRTYGFERPAQSPSKLHIVNPQGRAERGASHFCLALGATGHHVVSNEVLAGAEILPQYKYNLTRNSEYAEHRHAAMPSVSDFMDDVVQACGPDDWILVLRSSASHRIGKLHFTFGGEKGDTEISQVQSPTVHQAELAKLAQFIDEVREAMTPLGYPICTHDDFPSTSPNLLHNYLHHLTGANVISMFVSVELLAATDKDYYELLAALHPCLRILSD